MASSDHGRVDMALKVDHRHQQKIRGGESHKGMADFAPKVLNSRELGEAITANVEKNVRLVPQRDRALIAKLYDKFRHRIGPMLLSNDWSDASAIVSMSLVADMMKLMNKFKAVDGRAKKEIILEVLDLVIEHEAPPEQRAKLRSVLVNNISPAIDLAAYYVQSNPSCWQKLKCCGR